jgi:flagellar biosynthesis/type III secretory pathway chaperone
VNFAATATATVDVALPVLLAATDWEAELSSLLDELSNVQDELFQVLDAKRQRLMTADCAGIELLQQREESVCQRLEQCHQRRTELLAEAQRRGLPSDSVQKLADSASSRSQSKLGKQAKAAAANMRLLQHQSLTNWVLAQRAVLHVSQLIEIIATGGRLQPTYGSGDTLHNRGSLVDQEA